MNQNEFSAITSATAQASNFSAGGLDLNSLRLSQEFNEGVGVKKVVTTIPMRKPGNQTFIQVHPNPEFRFQTAMLQLKDDGECYLVTREVMAEVAQEIRPKMLYFGITRDGVPFLWPVNLPAADGRLDSWSESAHKAAEIAQQSWVRLVANRAFGAYDVMQATGNLDAPKWPDLTFEAVLQLAFKDRVIGSTDHPVIRRLRGEV